jgi:hypothetical protein
VPPLQLQHVCQVRTQPMGLRPVSGEQHLSAYYADSYKIPVRFTYFLLYLPGQKEQHRNENETMDRERAAHEAQRCKAKLAYDGMGEGQSEVIST